MPLNSKLLALSSNGSKSPFTSPAYTDRNTRMGKIISYTGNRYKLVLNQKKKLTFFFPMRPTLLYSSYTQLCIPTSAKKKVIWLIIWGDLNILIIIFTRALHSSVHGNLMRMHMTHNQLKCLRKCLADLWSEFNKHWSSWSVLVSYICVITQEQWWDTDFSGEEQ